MPYRNGVWISEAEAQADVERMRAIAQADQAEAAKVLASCVEALSRLTQSHQAAVLRSLRAYFELPPVEPFRPSETTKPWLFHDRG